MVWRRERVGRTSTVVEVGVDKERARGVDPAAVREAVGEAPAWNQRRWRRHGIEADAKEDRARSVDPTAVGEAVGEASAWTQ
jgi:hypothetical protein